MEGKGGRILSLDVLRGLTVACMILVNNGTADSFPALRHAAWNGLTLSDMVFPFFLFIMGISIHFSRKGKPGQILRRTGIIILICWGIRYVEYALGGDFLPWAHFRLTGVLVRIALCYLAAALLCLYAPARLLPWLSGVLLAGYTALLLCGNGYAPDASNILSVADRALLGEAHLYHKSPVDPEGLLSTLPALAHTLLGCICGRMLKRDGPLPERLRRMALYGLILAGAGLLLSLWLPLNKRIWSPSYALFTSGSCALLLAALGWLVDLRGRRGWTPFFEAFGRNALAIYILSELLSAVAGQTGFSGWLYGLLSAVCPYLPAAALLYAFFFVGINWLAAYILYKKRIFVKI